MKHIVPNGGYIKMVIYLRRIRKKTPLKNPSHAWMVVVYDKLLGKYIPIPIRSYGPKSSMFGQNFFLVRFTAKLDPGFQCGFVKAI